MKRNTDRLAKVQRVNEGYVRAVILGTDVHEVTLEGGHLHRQQRLCLGGGVGGVHGLGLPGFGHLAVLQRDD